MKIRDLLVLAGGVAAATQVGALSLGHSNGKVQLGMPVDVVFNVQPDSGQTAASSCVRAAVKMGDAALLSKQVQVLPLSSNQVRVRSTSVVNEPLVNIQLTAGCKASVSRSYVFFADLPSSVSASPTPIDLQKIQVQMPNTASAAVNTPQPSKLPRGVAKRVVSPQASQASDVAPASSPAKRAVNASAAANAAGSAALADTPSKAQAVAAPLPAPLTNNALPVEATAAASTAAELPAPNSLPTAASTLIDTASENTASAEPPGADNPSATLATSSQEDNSANHEAPDAAAVSQALVNNRAELQASAQRLENLEQELLQLQSQLTSNHAQITQLQTQLMHSQNAGLPIWVYVSLGLLALALAATAWMLWRVRQAREESDRTAQIAASVPLPNKTEATASPHFAPASNGAKGVVNAPVSKVPSSLAAQAVATATSVKSAEPVALLDDVTPQSVIQPRQAPAEIAEVLTAQAMFDVQEQADFYASIGENDQAIAILQAHIKANLSSSPLAYIELLQLLYRLGRAEVFAEIRQQFEHYFNVKVPDFMSFSRKGFDLWSAHPDVLAKIEAAWPNQSVLNMLGQLIVRQPSPASNELPIRFDLAAFDDLLMLYSVAQTTLPEERGLSLGRQRTTPLEAPLPEVFFEEDQELKPALVPHFLGLETTPSKYARPSSASEVSDDALSEAVMQALSAPISTEKPHSVPLDSPFQGPAQSAPNEQLVQELSLDWSDMDGKPEADQKTSSTASDFSAIGAEIDAELELLALGKAKNLPDHPSANQP